MTQESTLLLNVDKLEVVYRAREGKYKAVDGVSLEIRPGEIVGLVGESGCGKSTLGSAILKLLPPNGDIVGGHVQFQGRDVSNLSTAELRKLRGKDLAVIWQDPLTSLNPVFKIEEQMIDAQRAHSREPSNVLRQRAIEALEQVGIPDPGDRIGHYPHQFSGGMLQRVVIAMALTMKPKLVIADEPTSALDLTIQAQVLELLRQLREQEGTAILFVSHDLGVIAEICDRVVVMYAGRSVEEADVYSLFERPRHPYTQALLSAIPSREHRNEQLATIKGRVPSLSQLPLGCTFADRCPYVQGLCHKQEPAYIDIEGHHARCYIHDPDSAYEVTPQVEEAMRPAHNRTR